jgi:adenylosuccinate synthase
MKASVVVGLGFGDEGKGLMTDYLCANSTEPTLVVRFSGGQQAGHNVVIGEKSHIHASYCSGALRGLPSYISQYCTFYPPNIERERDILGPKGGNTGELYIHPHAMLTTPYDVAFNRLREFMVQHSTCGMGVGATMHRNLTTPYKLYAIDMQYPDILKRKLEGIRKYYNDKILQEFDMIDRKSRNIYYGTCDTELEFFEDLFPYTIRDYAFVKENFQHIIFEGSQGILLDMDHGVFPNVTYGHTSSRNAVEICNSLNIKHVSKYLMTRCYTTRHGKGWMPNTPEINLVGNEKETNFTNEWQGSLKVRELDYDLLKYAINVDKGYMPGESYIVVTCLDQRPDFLFDKSKFHLDHRFLGSYGPKAKDVKELK